MSKYIIELDENAKKVVAISLEDGIMWTNETEVENLEELNSDYINEHYGQLQDEAYKRGINDGSLDVKQRVEGAYQRGLEEGKKATWELVADASNAEYQKGLNDAWECARKLYLNGACKDLFGEYFNTFIKNHTAQEAIEKLKAHTHDDEINVGDEVDWSGDKFIVTRIFRPHNNAEECDGVDMDGCTYHDVLISGLTKTGRHVDITDMLKGARNEHLHPARLIRRYHDRRELYHSYLSIPGGEPCGQ